MNRNFTNMAFRLGARFPVETRMWYVYRDLETHKFVIKRVAPWFPLIPISQQPGDASKVDSTIIGPNGKKAHKKISYFVKISEVPRKN